jgi:hypothetical protein
VWWCKPSTGEAGKDDYMFQANLGYPVSKINTPQKQKANRKKETGNQSF